MRNFEISKYRLFCISSFQILTPTLSDRPDVLCYAYAYSHIPWRAFRIVRLLVVCIAQVRLQVERECHLPAVANDRGNVEYSDQTKKRTISRGAGSLRRRSRRNPSTSGTGEQSGFSYTYKCVHAVHACCSLHRLLRLSLFLFFFLIHLYLFLFLFLNSSRLTLELRTRSQSKYFRLSLYSWCGCCC